MLLAGLEPAAFGLGNRRSRPTELQELLPIVPGPLAHLAEVLRVMCPSHCLIFDALLSSSGARSRQTSVDVKGSVPVAEISDPEVPSYLAELVLDAFFMMAPQRPLHVLHE